MRLSKAASLASTVLALPRVFENVLLVPLPPLVTAEIPATSRLPPLPPKADVKLVLFVRLLPLGGAALVSFVHFDRPGWCGTAGGIGRIELVRFGGLPGVVVVGCWRALSSQEDLVGDQRFREGMSALVEVERRRDWAASRVVGRSSAGGDRVGGREGSV